MQCIIEFIVLKKRLMSKSYIPGINTSILPKKYDENIFSEKLVNELYAWIKNHPHVINYPNVKDSFFVKINGTILMKENIYFEYQYESYTMI